MTDQTTTEPVADHNAWKRYAENRLRDLTAAREEIQRQDAQLAQAERERDQALADVTRIKTYYVKKTDHLRGLLVRTRNERDDTQADLDCLRTAIEMCADGYAQIDGGTEQVKVYAADVAAKIRAAVAAALPGSSPRAQDVLAAWIERAIDNPRSIVGPRRGPHHLVGGEHHTPAAETVVEHAARAVMAVIRSGGRLVCEVCDRTILPTEQVVPPLPGIGLWQHDGCPTDADGIDYVAPGVSW